MKKTEKDINLMMDLIQDGENTKVKNLVEKGIDIHFSNDYFLYLATFKKNEELQKYFIDIGLDPEATKGRLAVAHPEGFAFLRRYRREKEAREYAQSLNDALPNKDTQKPKLKV